MVLCVKDNENCVTLIDNEGSTIRGCESSISINCSLNDNCQLCSNDLCNSDVYPKDRKKCIHCEGENCANPSTDSKICNIYEVNQKCYTAVEGKQTLSYLYTNNKDSLSIYINI